MGHGKATPQEVIDFVLTNYGTMGNREMATALGRSFKSVDNILYRLRKQGKLPPRQANQAEPEPVAEPEPEPPAPCVHHRVCGEQSIERALPGYFDSHERAPEHMELQVCIKCGDRLIAGYDDSDRWVAKSKTAPRLPRLPFVLAAPAVAAETQVEIEPVDTGGAMNGHFEGIEERADQVEAVLARIASTPSGLEVALQEHLAEMDRDIEKLAKKLSRMRARRDVEAVRLENLQLKRRVMELEAGR